jgi:hypothetical protein
MGDGMSGCGNARPVRLNEHSKFHQMPKFRLWNRNDKLLKKYPVGRVVTIYPQLSVGVIEKILFDDNRLRIRFMGKDGEYVYDYAITDSIKTHPDGTIIKHCSCGRYFADEHSGKRVFCHFCESLDVQEVGVGPMSDPRNMLREYGYE